MMLVEMRIRALEDGEFHIFSHERSLLEAIVVGAVEVSAYHIDGSFASEAIIAGDRAQNEFAGVSEVAHHHIGIEGIEEDVARALHRA